MWYSGFLVIEKMQLQKKLLSQTKYNNYCFTKTTCRCSISKWRQLWLEWNKLRGSQWWGSSSLTQPLVVQSALVGVINRPGRPVLMGARWGGPPAASSQGGLKWSPQARQTCQRCVYSGRRVKEKRKMLLQAHGGLFFRKAIKIHLTLVEQGFKGTPRRGAASPADVTKVSHCQIQKKPPWWASLSEG